MVACYGCWMHAASSEYLDSSFVCLCCHTADDEKCIHLSINAHDKEGSRTYTKNWDKAQRCNFSYAAFISDLFSMMLSETKMGFQNWTSFFFILGVQTSYVKKFSKKCNLRTAKNIEKFVYFRSKKYGSLQFDEIFDKKFARIFTKTCWDSVSGFGKVSCALFKISIIFFGVMHHAWNISAFECILTGAASFLKATKGYMLSWHFPSFALF